MQTVLRLALAIAGLVIATQAAAQITFYEHEDFRGRYFTTESPVANFQRHDFSGLASSVEVHLGRWEVCSGERHSGNCTVLRPGRYPSLYALGLNDRVSSVQEIGRDTRIDDRRYAPGNDSSQITLYEHEDFQGRSFTAENPVGNFKREGFSNQASSIVIRGQMWEVCSGKDHSGRCSVLRQGRYPSLAATGLNARVTSVRPVGWNADDDPRNRAAPTPAQAIFYERDGFRGQSITTVKWIDDFSRHGFRYGSSSIEVLGERWEVCEGPGFSGRCSVLRPGRYASLEDMQLRQRVASVRVIGSNVRISDRRYAPLPGTPPDFRRHRGEQLYEANVTSVRAVVGTPEQRCWVEQEQIPQERSKVNVQGAVIGAIIGGILGHQVIHGSKQTVATVGGAAVGAAVGANVGREDDQPARTQDVERCEDVPSQAQPEYWDVIYTFRGMEHRIQMVAPPGRTVTVNEHGEPRV